MKTYPQLLGKFAAANTEQHVLVAAFNINSPLSFLLFRKHLEFHLNVYLPASAVCTHVFLPQTQGKYSLYPGSICILPCPLNY